jgi:GntR family transcriptional regulator/MocR family aminotransferase
VPVDGEGIDVAAGIARAPAARLAVVTPAHQAPLGMPMSLPRRLALLAWAEAAEAFVVEDDYDGEFRYEGRPPAALASLDSAGRVLYAGTFSKTLFPGLRLGYLVVPEPLVGRFERAADLLSPARAAASEMALADFLAEGHFARHVRRMRALYAERRAALAAAVKAVAGERLRVAPGVGGLHLLARLPDGEDAAAVATRALAAGLAPAALAAFEVEARHPPSLLLGFTNTPAEAAAEQVQRLLAAWEAR